MLPHRNVGQIVNLILHIAIATWSLQAARAFKSVATTDVADQAYLVQGFTKLRSIFLLQGVLILVGLAFVTAVLLFLVLHGAGLAERCIGPWSDVTGDFCSTSPSASISLA